MGALHAIFHDQIFGPAGHVAAASVLGASVWGLLNPPVTVILSCVAIVWYVLEIWEMRTVQKIVSWFKKQF